MGLLDDVTGKAKDLVEGNEDKVEAGIDAAADFADDKTGGEHTDKIDMASDKAKDLLTDD